jgi:hypothetical protein
MSDAAEVENRHPHHTSPAISCDHSIGSWGEEEVMQTEFAVRPFFPVSVRSRETAEAISNFFEFPSLSFLSFSLIPPSLPHVSHLLQRLFFFSRMRHEKRNSHLVLTICCEGDDSNSTNRSERIRYTHAHFVACTHFFIEQEIVCLAKCNATCIREKKGISVTREA